MGIIPVALTNSTAISMLPNLPCPEGVDCPSVEEIQGVVIMGLGEQRPTTISVSPLFNYSRIAALIIIALILWFLLYIIGAIIYLVWSIILSILCLPCHRRRRDHHGYYYHHPVHRHYRRCNYCQHWFDLEVARGVCTRCGRISVQSNNFGLVNGDLPPSYGSL